MAFHLFRAVHEFDCRQLINCTPNRRRSVVEKYVFDLIYILSLQDSPRDEGPPTRATKVKTLLPSND